MGRKGYLSAALLALLVCFGSHAASADIFAKQNRAEVLYGKGVHAFFDNDFSGGADLLLEVEQLGSQDPRPYYFLGLSYLRMNDDRNAEKYFRLAAKFEWEGRSFRDYNVSDALRRVQGKERLYIEMFRRQAKREWQEAEQRRLKEMYKKEEATDKEILTSLTKPFVGTSLFGARSLDPFADDPKNTAETAIPNEDDIPALPPRADRPKTPVTTPSKTDAPKPTVQDDDDSDPFGATPAPAPKKSSSDDDDPFADDEDDSDPFGATPAPAAKKSSSDDDDPFADEEVDDNPFN